MGQQLTPGISAALTQRASSLDLEEQAPAHIPDASLEVHIVTIEGQGRVRLARIAGPMQWRAGDALVLDVQDGIVRLGDAALVLPHQHSGLQVKLDARLRIQLPIGIRTLLGLEPGTQLVLLGAPAEGAAAGIPVVQFFERIVAGR